MTSKDTSKPADRVMLVSPDVENLSGLEAALAQGWSPDPRRLQDQAYIRARLRALRRDKSKFMNDLANPGAPSLEPRLRNHLFWIWDGEFCGSIGLRFQTGREELPPHIPGHVGYSVVPWKQRNGYATTALRLLLAVAGNEGLKRIVVLCDADNYGSRRVIERNGGELFLRAPHPSDEPDRVKLHFYLKSEMPPAAGQNDARGEH
jgi:predicted acetyltransferase